ncbi:Transcriptional regulatory protein LnrK [Emticicia aquatica]|jgi:two-component system, NarL family, response regulator LiaR|uniref:Transcriptional regulatory protein LnrK n=1 Tax=Emticicia aquatica TaxID=1681835 RepID=A0ABN8EQH7_9BACT|nr:response regulator transcription factor [Emticicia aquatica]CAH0995155.1 Transcriptional regulatory protein LnrK [Emticicia aquatica]
MSETVIKVALYEDNDTLRTSLSHLLQSSEEFNFLGSYNSPVDIIQNCNNTMPDVILMDVDMPLMNGIDATKLVKEQFPQINILILTVFEDKEKLFSALQAGASGYLLKKSKIIEIIEAIHEIYHGGSPMTPAIARKVLEYFTIPKIIKNEENNLSERELVILKCLVDGDSYKMIASNCYISMGTVRSHINNIYKKLHVNSKSEAVVKALKDKLV